MSARHPGLERYLLEHSDRRVSSPPWRRPDGPRRPFSRTTTGTGWCPVRHSRGGVVVEVGDAHLRGILEHEEVPRTDPEPLRSSLPTDGLPSLRPPSS